MSAISIKSDDFKFLTNGTGSVDIDAQNLPLGQPLDPSTPALLNAKFNAQGAPPFSFGSNSDVKLTISGGTTATLKPFFKTAPELSDRGLDKFFDSNPQKFLLAFDIAAQAAADAAITYKYSVLSAGAEFKAGGDGEFWFSRAYDTGAKLGDILRDFVSTLRPPSLVSGPLAAGEVIYLEYGGYLNLGLNLSVGYQMQGSRSIDIAKLLLSESYSLSLLGKVGLTAGVAGNFSIQLRPGDTDKSWIHVSVQKKHSNQLSFAADVTVNAEVKSSGLPDTAQDFLGALLGVNAKNWINFAQQIMDSGTPDELKKRLDTLSESFLTKWVGKGIDALSTTEFKQFLDGLHKIATSYQNLDTTAVNLFDKYFTLGEPSLTNALQQLRHLTKLDQLAKLYTDSNLIKFIEELTGGDPLGFILDAADLKDPAGNSLTKPILDVFNGRVEDALSLLQDDSHSLLKKYITLAKSKFGIDGFVNQLADVSTLDGLKQKADETLNGFVERIIGKAIDDADQGQLKKILAVLKNISDFEKNLYSKLQQALNQTASLALHAEYTRARETDTLLEIEANPATPAGRDALHAAARGDFTGILRTPITVDYRILGGTLLDTLTRTGKLTFNVAGWHANFNYSSIESLILNTQQQIVAGDQGTLTVFTTVELKNTEDIQKNSQELHAAFLLRLIGETRGGIGRPMPLDPKMKKYLIDTVTGMSASYRLLLEDKHANKQRVADFLKFAAQFGLADVTADTVLPFMDTENSGGRVTYGDVTADYQVRFLDQAIQALFQADTPAATIRSIMRQVTVAALLADQGLQDLGRAYGTQQVYDKWKASPPQFSHVPVDIELPVAPLPFPSMPSRDTVTLSGPLAFTLGNFFFHEDEMVDAFVDLQKLVRSGQKLDPDAFAKRMGKFAKSFDLLDAGMRTNAMFSVFDRLIGLSQPAAGARGSSLKLTSTAAPNPERTKVFLSKP